MADINVNGGCGWIFLALLIVYFYGDPDLHDLVQEAVATLKASRNG